MEKLKQNKKILLIVGIVVLLIIIYIIAPKKPKEEQESSSSLSNTEITTEITEANAAESEPVDEVKGEPEHNTSEYVDYLALKAKEDAKTATDEDIQNAIDWLKNNQSDFFSGNENMENTMYYGELLEYKYKDTGDELEKIGWQAFKTVKYVYRGAESVLDDTTHDNLTELKEMLDNYEN